MHIFKIKIINQKPIFTKSDLNHLQVLHIKKNDILNCVDFNNNPFNLLVTHTNPFAFEIIKTNSQIKLYKPYEITCYLAVIKKPNFELAIKKLSELNLKKVVPVYFEFSQFNIKYDFKRLNKIASESIKQCNRTNSLIINYPIHFNDLLNQLNEYDLTFLAYEKQKVSEWNKISKLKPKKIAYLIGPEGGISLNEIKILKNKCCFLKLTNTILKSETAAIYLAANLIERFFKNAK